MKSFFTSLKIKLVLAVLLTAIFFSGSIYANPLAYTTTIVNDLSNAELLNTQDLDVTSELQKQLLSKDRVAQSKYAILSESTDSDSDNTLESSAAKATIAGYTPPVGGGFVPDSSMSPKVDGYEMPLGYCVWDNGTTNSSTDRIDGVAAVSNTDVSFAIVSSGSNRVFDSTCADLASGSVAGDDVFESVLVGQTNYGVATNEYFGKPIADLTTLTGLDTTNTKDGEFRVLLEDNSTYVWTGADWQKTSGGGSSAFTQKNNGSFDYLDTTLAVSVDTSENPIGKLTVGHEGTVGGSSSSLADAAFIAQDNVNADRYLAIDSNEIRQFGHSLYLGGENGVLFEVGDVADGDIITAGKIDSTGNWGLGIESPAEKLHIDGNLKLEDTDKILLGNGGVRLSGSGSTFTVDAYSNIVIKADDIPDNDTESLTLGAGSNLLVIGSGGASGQTDEITYNGNKVYHAGNVGTGSSLDSDLLDGLNSDQFVRADTDSSFTNLTGESVTVSNALTIDKGTDGDAVLTLRSDTDNNNESDHPSIRLKQDGDTVDWRLGLGLNAGDATSSNDDLVLARIAGASGEVKISPDGISSYKVLHAGNANSEDIAYDNTVSGLTATTVKAAIDELSSSGGGGASSINDLTDAKHDGSSIGLGTNALANDDGALNLNSAFGNNSLYQNTSGTNNSGFGAYALQENTVGSGNSGFGMHALSGIVGGSNNAGFGYYAGKYLADGITENTNSETSLFLGGFTKSGAGESSNETVIGYDAVGKGSNTFSLGNSHVTKMYFAENLVFDSAQGGLYYDNSTSGLTATSVGAAIDELATTRANGSWVEDEQYTGFLIDGGAGLAVIALDNDAAQHSAFITYGNERNVLKFERHDDNFGLTKRKAPVKFDLNAPGNSLKVKGSGTVWMKHGIETANIDATTLNASSLTLNNSFRSSMVGQGSQGIFILSDQIAWPEATALDVSLNTMGTFMNHVSMDGSYPGDLSAYFGGHLGDGTDGGFAIGNYDSFYGRIDNFIVGKGFGAGSILQMEADAISIYSPSSTFSGDVTANSFISTSDRRYKDDIQQVGNALETVLGMRGTSYYWKKDEERTRRSYGFIAQELLEVLPDAVHQNDEGYYSVQYDAVTPVLVEAVKELNSKVTVVEDKVADHEKRIQVLEDSRIAVTSQGEEVTQQAQLLGSEKAVYDRGSSEVVNGRVTIHLSGEFVSLADMEGATILLTPIFDGVNPVSQLAATPVSNGSFEVVTTDDKNLGQKFHWEVKAKRAGETPMIVQTTWDAFYATQ